MSKRRVRDSARRGEIGTHHAAASARTALLDGLHTSAGIITMLRSFDRDTALGWVGLARRAGPLRTMGIFGAGLA